MNNLQQQVAKWLGEPVQELPAANASDVQAVFEALGYTASSDVIALYERIGGMQSMDENYFRLWPLAQVREENASRSPHGVLFADYLINSWCYRVKPVSETEGSVYVDHFDGSPPLLVGRSLDEFFRSCLSDPESVLHQPRHIDAEA